MALYCSRLQETAIAEQNMSNVTRWALHTSTTDPAEFEALISRQASDVISLSRSIQRIIVHTDCLAMYGLDASSMAGLSRTTLPVHERLRRLTAVDRLDLVEGRPPAGRQVGTCRDFALFLCSFLRTHGTPARVRCGFASYFGEGWWDHWICEYWNANRAVWLRADAELDDTMSKACNIRFDPSEMPDGAFMTAGEAWLGCRAGQVSPDDFGHGEHKGLWFISMNVARDSLSLNGQEMSSWDTWREARLEARQLSPDQILRIDAIAHHPEHLPDPLTPPWLTPLSASRNRN